MAHPTKALRSNFLALAYSVCCAAAGTTLACTTGSGGGSGPEADSTTTTTNATATSDAGTSDGSGATAGGGSGSDGASSGSSGGTQNDTSTSAGGNGGSGGSGGEMASGGGTENSSGTETASTTGASTSGGSCAMDECPAPGGYVAYECRLRFMYGVNYAWHAFAGDFGGIAMWDQAGVSGDSAAVSQELADMAQNGVSVVRWWVWPDFRGDGVAFNGNTATGLGGTAQLDLERALELAEEHDLYLMLTLFSFDGFRSGNGPNLRDVVTDAGSLDALVENAVRPFAAVAEASPHKERLIAWDVINEPEWAMQGPSPYGDDAYEADNELSPVNHEEMETFVAAVLEGLRQESGALTTVGGAALKWARAWSNVDIDFYQFHIYDWVNDYWPYDAPPSAYGVDDKPVVMGEFPVDGLSGVPYQTMLQSWYENGYSGALGWSVTDANFNWNSAKGAVRAFAEQHACETSY